MMGSLDPCTKTNERLHRKRTELQGSLVHLVIFNKGGGVYVHWPSFCMAKLGSISRKQHANRVCELSLSGVPLTFPTPLSGTVDCSAFLVVAWLYVL